MSNDLNRTILIGRLTRDPEMRYTPSGTAVASFSIANGRTFTMNGEKTEQVSFFNCVAWSKLAEVIVQYCKKGDKVAIEGRLDQKRWEDQEGNKKNKVEVTVNTIQFLSSSSAEPREAKQDPGPSNYDGTLNSMGQSVDLPFDENPFNDDDIPF